MNNEELIYRYKGVGICLAIAGLSRILTVRRDCLLDVLGSAGIDTDELENLRPDLFEYDYQSIKELLE